MNSRLTNDLALYLNILKQDSQYQQNGRYILLNYWLNIFHKVAEPDPGDYDTINTKFLTGFVNAIIDMRDNEKMISLVNKTSEARRKLNNIKVNNSDYLESVAAIAGKLFEASNKLQQNSSSLGLFTQRRASPNQLKSPGDR